MRQKKLKIIIVEMKIYNAFFIRADILRANPI
jgi:hypothetical protein